MFNFNQTALASITNHSGSLKSSRTPPSPPPTTTALSNQESLQNHFSCSCFYFPRRTRIKAEEARKWALTRPPLGFEYILEPLGQPSPVLFSILKLPHPIQQVNLPSLFF